MKEKNHEEQVTTSIRMPTAALKRAKNTAHNIGMSQSSFFRFAILTTITRIERGEI